MARLLLGVLAALLLWPTATFAETPAEYRAALVEMVEAADAALAALPEGVSLAEHPPLARALARLEAITAVTAATGDTIAVDNSVISRQLRGSHAEGQAVVASLHQLRRALDDAAARDDWTREVDFGASLARVLARPEFRGGSGNSIAELIADLRARLYRWLEGLVPGLTVPSLPDVDLDDGVSAAGWVLAVATVIFLAVFCLFVWLRARPKLARYAALRSPAQSDQEDARTARLLAQRAAEAGDYRSAVHYLYLWATRHLAEQARLRYDHSLTNHEQLRALAADGEAAEPLRAAVEAFDRLWYGRAICTAVEYGQFRNVVERIVGATL